MADALTGYVDDATVDREQKRAARESLKDIWADVEVKAQTKPWHVIQKQQKKQREEEHQRKWKTHDDSRRAKQDRKKPEKEGKTTLYTLKSDEGNVTKTLKDAESKVRESNGVRTASVTESEATSLSELSDTIGSGMKNDEKSGDGKVRPHFYHKTHKKITRVAIDNWHSFEPEPSEKQMGKWSTWPDEPTEHSEISYTPVPDGFPLAKFPESGGQAYAHAYNPDYIIERIDPTHPFPSLPGATPHYTGEYMSTAINDESYKHLSFACHVVEDMAMPFHTGAWVRGKFLQNAHSKFESAVNARIEEDFLKNIENIDNCYAVPNSPWWDPDDKWSKHTKNLANKSSDYADSFATKIAETDDDSASELIDSYGLLSLFTVITARIRAVDMGLTESNPYHVGSKNRHNNYSIGQLCILWASSESSREKCNRPHKCRMDRPMDKELLLFVSLLMLGFGTMTSGCLGGSTGDSPPNQWNVTFDEPTTGTVFSNVSYSHKHHSELFYDVKNVSGEKSVDSLQVYWKKEGRFELYENKSILSRQESIDFIIYGPIDQSDPPNRYQVRAWNQTDGVLDKINVTIRNERGGGLFP